MSILIVRPTVIRPSLWTVCNLMQPKDDQFSRLSPMFYYMKFRIGVCIPSTCDQTDMDSIAQALSSSLRLNITIPDCRVRQAHVPMTNQQLVSGLVLALILFIVLGSTLVDWSRRKWDQMEAQNIKLISMATSEQNHYPSSPMMNNLDGPTGKQGFRSFIYGRSVASSISITDQPLAAAKNKLSHAACSREPNYGPTQPSADLAPEEASRQPFGKHWAWMSFSMLTNFRLYFSENHHEPQANHGARSGPAGRPAARLAAACRQDGCISAAGCGRSRDSPLVGRGIMIKCLNGIRVLSLCWVIVANSYITLDPRATKRLAKTREAPKDFLFQIIVQASLAIETFFFLSGVLMSLSFAKQYSRTGSSHRAARCRSSPGHEDGRQPMVWTLLKWLHFYVHRYIRMTPATMLVIALSMYAYRFGDGPLWFETTQKAHQNCSQNWWRHLLHVANFIDTRQMCFIHYWYIAADMQLFLFAPIIMYLLYRYRNLGLALMALIGSASVGFVFYTTYARNLPPTLLFYNSDPESRREFGNTIMTKPLTHALPYMVGMLVGYWLSAKLINGHPPSTRGSPGDPDIAPRERDNEAAQKDTGPRTASASSIAASLPHQTVYVLGSLAIIVGLVEIFLPYKWNNSHLPNRFMASLYAALFRLGWSLVLACLVVSCRHRRDSKCVGPPVGTGADGGLVLRDKRSSPNACCSWRFVGDNPRSPASCGAVDQHRVACICSHGHDRQTGCANNDIDHHLSFKTQTPGIRSPATSKRLDCFCGSGGNLVNRLLSLEMFTHLSKLSFVAYLIHLPLMSLFISQTRGLFAFSHTLVIHLAISYLVMTFAISFILVHIIEFPFITFERFLFENLLYKQHRPQSPREEDVRARDVASVNG